MADNTRYISNTVKPAAGVYTTVQGDTFDAIAFRIWGKESMAHLLMEANPNYADVMVFAPHVEIWIPDVEPETTVDDLPPWYFNQYLAEEQL